MLDRVLGVFRLDVATFEEIEHDAAATTQAAAVVAIVAVLAAIGGSMTASISGGRAGSSFLASFIGAFAGWFIWSFLTYWVGTTLFEGKADLGEMLRVIGFAYAPQSLAIFPCLGAFVGGIWSLVAGFIAVRQGLDLDNTKAFFTIVIGFLAYVAFAAVIMVLFGGMRGPAA